MKYINQSFSQGKKIIFPGRSNLMLVHITEHTGVGKEQIEHLFYMFTNGERHVSSFETKDTPVLPMSHWLDVKLHTPAHNIIDLTEQEHEYAVDLAQLITMYPLHGYTIGDLKKPTNKLLTWRIYLYNALHNIFGSVTFDDKVALAYEAH